MSRQSTANRSLLRLVAATMIGAAGVLGMGVPELTAPASAAPNLVVNPSFEEPEVAKGEYQIFESIPGWTFSPRPGAVTGGIELQNHYEEHGPAPGAGEQFLELDSDGSTRVAQDVLVQQGATYRVSFLSSPRPGIGPEQNAFTLTANEQRLAVGPHGATRETRWTRRTLTVVADRPSIRLRFTDDGPSDTYGAFIDEVSITRIAGPCGKNAPPSGVIAYTALQGADRDIWTMTPDGGGQRQITRGGVSDEPSFSRDGTRIAFTRSLRGSEQPQSRIYLVDADGTVEIALTDGPGEDHDAAFSPDGRRVVFSSNRGGDYDIYVVNVDGTGLTQLTDDPADDGQPTFSADGTQIAFASTRAYADPERFNLIDIYAMNIDGTNVVNLTASPPGSRNIDDYREPAFSPIGDALAAYAQERRVRGQGGDYTGLVRMRPDGTARHRLRHHGFSPSFSPDGERLAFASGYSWPDGFRANIFVIDSEGSRLTQLTSAPTPGRTGNVQPSWGETATC